MGDLDTWLLSISLLIIISIIITRITKNLGVPVMLFFIGIGMLAGSEGLGRIYFDDATVAQNIGVIALIFILFSGGLDTKWNTVTPVLKSALSLSTIGVIVTTFSIGTLVHLFFNLPLSVSFLFGAVVSSTDAAAVFSILSFSNLNLKGRVKPLLELESGTNDPMAVFLTISLIEIILAKTNSYSTLFIFFIFQMGLGFLIGVIGGRGLVFLINKVRFPMEGFYTVFTLAFSILIYSLTSSFKGSGFLAVYVAGVIVSNNEILHKRTIFRFFDGLAWLSQIGMFLTLGLLVYPSKIIPIIPSGLLISFLLIFIARPAGVFTSLAFSKFTIKEKLLISWIGLRGAVPIVLATFPLLAGIKHSEWIFNVIFFIVLTSTLLQGWSIPWVAKFLKLDAPSLSKIIYPIEFSAQEGLNLQLINLKVPESPKLANKSLVEIPSLKGNLVVMVSREGKYFVPSGGTILQTGDILQVLVEKEKIKELREGFSK